MKDKIIQYIIHKIVENFLASLRDGDIKRSLDRLIDRLEKQVVDSKNKYDDNLVPVLKYIREIFDIPDYPETN